MTTQPPVSPSDAPFTAGTIPPGWSEPMTQEQADAANTLYPVPPYGNTYFPPAPPPSPPAQVNAKFVKLMNIQQGLTTHAMINDPDQLALMHVDLIFPLWPLAGVLGIVDDVGVRPVRILNVTGDVVEFNFDSTGLDVSGLQLIGVIYVGP